MSSAGIFRLIANDGKADRMIMATELLNARIRDTMCMRAKQGFQDPTPTLVDIEKTHILFVNAHFKPFAALGYEYNKTSTYTGTAQFGGTIQWNIPQFGDFFSDMAVNIVLEQTSATAGVVPALPAFVGPADQVLTATSSVSARVNAVAGTYTKYTYEYVDAQGNVLSVGSPATNFVRYAEYPGQRLFKKVKFDVNGNPLDEYTSETYLFHQKFCVHPNKVVGWKRLVGQEVPVEAYSDLITIAGTSQFPSNVSNLVDINGNTVGPVNSSTTTRKVVHVVDGPQTPKAVQPELSIWQPLIFWFNKDVRLAIPSIAIPYGQRYITAELEAQNNILFVAPGNLFLRLTTEIQTSNAAVGAGTAAALQVYDVKRYVTYTPTLATGSTINSAQKILSAYIYINNIFVNPEIHDIYIRRIGFSLIRVHKFQSHEFKSSADEIQLTQLKFPVEYICLGFRPKYNISVTNPNQYRDWHRLTLLTDKVVDVNAKAYGTVITDDTVPFNDPLVGNNPLTRKTFESQIKSESYTYPSETEVVNTLNLRAHGVEIYQDFSVQFFRDYLTYAFGDHNLNTPEDKGALFINFCLYPGSYQPSGHINVSRTREFFLRYTSSYITSATPCDLLVQASAINFLLVSDGSAVLRYST